jgi:hypothetical protein
VTDGPGQDNKDPVAQFNDPALMSSFAETPSHAAELIILQPESATVWGLPVLRHRRIVLPVAIAVLVLAAVAVVLVTYLTR